MRRELGIISCIVALLVGGFGFVTPGHAAGFTVNSTADRPDKLPGDGICRDTANLCSLRAAVMEANKLPGADTITLPAGTYKLTRAGVGEDAGLTGDLDVITGPLTITGAAAATTIIDGGTSQDRVLDVRNKAALTMSLVTVQNGKGGTGQDDGGGGIRATGGSNLTLTNVTIQKNTSPYFGAGISFNYQAFGSPVPGKLMITTSTINDNIANRTGGGIALGGGSALDMRSSKLLTNIAKGMYDSSIAQYGGGALYLASGFTPISGTTMTTTAGLSYNTFDGNLANGEFSGDGWGGAIFSNVLSTVASSSNTFIRNKSESYGGAIYSSGRLVISLGTFNMNQAGDSGGAIEATGTTGTVITGANFIRNTAAIDSGQGGGAIDMNGPFTFKSVIVQYNTAAIGGGIRFTNSLGTLEAMNIHHNTATYDGGGIAAAPGSRGRLVTVLNSVVDRNTAQLNGGGIFNGGEMRVLNSSTTNNKATQGNGGGIYNYQSFAFAATTISVTGNIAGNAGGGIFTRHTTFGSNGVNPVTPIITGALISTNSANQGGGLENDLSVKLVNSAVVSNTATYGGGIYNAQRTNAAEYPRALDLLNVTISGNTASAAGAGLYSSMGRSYLNAVTVANNSGKPKVVGGATTGGGIYNNPTNKPQVWLANTILANNTAVNGPDCQGTLSSQNYNLIRTTTGCVFTGVVTNNKVANPLLNPLRNNGGKTLTHSFPSNSPVRNAGNPAAFASNSIACPAKDQRNANRIAPCDMGAYEISPLP